MSKIVELCDVVVGNEEDLQKGLGIAGVDVRACALMPAQPHAAEAARAIVRALRAWRGVPGVLTSTFGLVSPPEYAQAPWLWCVLLPIGPPE